MDKAHLKLYITAQTPKSIEIMDKVKAMLEKALKEDNYKLDVIDVLNNPGVAEEDGVIATPTLVKKEPPPEKAIIGHVTDGKKVLEYLELWEIKED